LISLIQTAEGALNETHSILQRMRELAVQSANDTNNDQDRAELQKEVDQLASALNDISEDTEFNTKSLLDGSFEGTFHVGANKGQDLSVSIDDMSAEALAVNGVLTEESAPSEFEIDGEVFSGEALLKGDTVVAVEINSEFYAVDDVEWDSEAETPAHATKSGAEVFEFEDGDVYGGIDISSQSSADSAIETIQTAIDNVSAERSKLGAVQNRLDHTINNLGTSAENLTAAESRIRDVDYDLAAA